MATNPVGAPLQRPVQERENVVIRFAGDSGDGMQVTGMQFTTESVFAGNEIGTLPDFPAEIRAPTGTLYGVSAFQVNFSSKSVFTPGDDLDALVVMNPAALKTNLEDLKQNGILILDKAEFNGPNLKKAEYNLGENTEIFASSYEIKPAQIAPGVYRNITGNTATALGFVAAAQKAGLPIFLGSYPITPASDILHELAGYKNFNVYTFQAEDEIAGVCAAIGASFGGAIAITTTSGPGMNLKAEAVGLAVKVELPLVITDIQRAGPSTGMPTKPEQADLLQSMYGRHGESPIPIIAASTPADCFDCAYEAVRIAIKYMTPVILLTDGQLANGSEPWLLPDADKLPPIPVEFRTDPEGFMPYLREEETLARPWAIPGTKGLEHRVGGIAGEHLTGNISYSPANNELMVRMRARKIAGIAREIAPTEVFGDATGDLLVLGWGSTFGPIREGVKQVREKGKRVSHVHLRYLNPLPPDLEETLKRFKQVMIAEMNMGQLLKMVRADYLIDAFGFNKIQGRPFKVSEIVNRINRALEG